MAGSTEKNGTKYTDCAPVSCDLNSLVQPATTDDWPNVQVSPEKVLKYTWDCQSAVILDVQTRTHLPLINELRGVVVVSCDPVTKRSGVVCGRASICSACRGQLILYHSGEQELTAYLPR